MIKALSILLIGMLSFQLSAQEHQLLDHFIAAELNGKVLLSWRITKGSTCNGIQIYRSVNGQNFEEIGEISGVCGSSLESVTYNFTDENPVKNKTNAYRLELGGYGLSEVLKKEVIDVQTNGYQIRPHPVSGTSKLYFNNPKYQPHVVTIYTLTGQTVTTLTTQVNFLEINASGHPAGIYLFTIQNELGQVISSGKLIFN